MCRLSSKLCTHCRQQDRQTVLTLPKLSNSQQHLPCFPSFCSKYVETSKVESRQHSLCSTRRLRPCSHLQQHSDVELDHHEHGVDAQHVPQAHLDAVAAVQVRVAPLTVAQHNDALVPAPCVKHSGSSSSSSSSSSRAQDWSCCLYHQSHHFELSPH